jgi:hypothetical protein
VLHLLLVVWMVVVVVVVVTMPWQRARSLAVRECCAAKSMRRAVTQRLRVRQGM